MISTLTVDAKKTEKLFLHERPNAILQQTEKFSKKTEKDFLLNFRKNWYSMRFLSFQTSSCNFYDFAVNSL